MQHVEDDTKTPPRRFRDAALGPVEGGVTQDRQRPGSRLPQHRLLGCPRDIGHKAYGLLIVGRVRRPDPLERERPFPELSVHEKYWRNDYDARVKLSIFVSEILN
jgi:hypothetical protein